MIKQGKKNTCKFQRDFFPLAVLIPALALALALNLRGETFVFSGTAVYTTLPGTTNARNSESMFQVQLDGLRWSIKTSDPAERLPTATYLFNGEKLYVETDWRTAKIMSANLAARPPSAVRTNAPQVVKQTYRIFPPEAIPAYNTDLAFPLWLAFTSGRFFGTNSKSSIPDCGAMGLGVMYPGEPAIEARLLNPGRSSQSVLQSDVDFLNPGFSLQRKQDAAPVSQPVPPPFDKGFISVKYRILKSDIIDGLNYPREATFDVFVPRLTPTSPAGVLHVTRTTLTTKAAKTDPQNLAALPVIDTNQPAPAIVKDYTHTTPLGTPISYSTKQDFIDTNNPRYARIVKDSTRRAESVQRDVERRQPRSKTMIWAILIGTVLGPLLVIWLHKQKQKTKPIEEN